MNQRFKNIVVYLAILFVLIAIVLWLNKYYFFICLENTDFNNLLTPIISLFSVILLIFTLSDSQKFNSRQLSMDEYTILLQDFEFIKTKLENMTFKMETKELSEIFDKNLEKADGINYMLLFSQILKFELPKDKKEKDQIISNFRFNIIFPLIREYRNLGIFIKEVIDNDTLSLRYKNKFYLKVEQLLLQHYFRICNNINSLGESEYELEIFDSLAYKAEEFKEINELYIKYDLFQINDLKFYKNTL